MDQREVSHQKAAILGLQHLLAMYSGAVAVPLLIGTALKFSPEQMTYLVSIDIFMCGLATLLQLVTTKFWGIGFPVILGCAIQAVAPLQMIGHKFSINNMYGAIIVAGIFVILIAGFFAKIKKFFPPVVTGTLITTIGLTLIPVAIQNMGGGNAAAKDFGSSQNLLLAFCTMFIILALEIWTNGFLQSISVLIGLISGTLIAACLNRVSFTPVIAASWFHLPQLFYFGAPHFEWSSSLTMIIIALVSMVESTGVFFATGDLIKHQVSEEDLKKGYRAEGIAQILGGLFNAFPYTTFSQNVGLLQLSGIKTKRPIYWTAGLLMTMGLLPKIGALVTIIPTPVLGGAMLVMFTMIAVQGIKTLVQVDLSNNNNILIIALSVGLGLGVTIYPQFFHNLPATIQLFLNNGIVITSLSATILNLLLNGAKSENSLTANQI
ncbi:MULTISPECIES: nucleobase:cation symporter-2 family protein [unclassified Lactobacillus]|uniref:nucleobase:cation symporter-2 family protein n=1 Tax=unclassified Lactobacillus TaxID=2620435 RepID=UPI000EFB5A4C|nr:MULTISPECIES: nucleobase:cation symporter-2 family protein [unclassified Lactobacillus]RMC23638.1 purine permease [Lactobacillus sp. ESL0247]RMC27399.1 purine permease [Lactobacillus sp. ESL0246]RMC30600.1 purine permease [Lactobacillus sp. ESL0245]